MLSQYRTRPEPPASQTPVTCGVCRPLKPQSIQDKNTPNPPPQPSSLRTLPDRNHFLIKICAFYTKKKTKLENEEEPEDFDEEVGRADQQSFISPSPLPPAFCSTHFSRPKTRNCSRNHCCKSPASLLCFFTWLTAKGRQNICVFLNFRFNSNICSMCFCLDQAMSENGGEDNMVGRSR